jgi:ubiquinone/menaquinone biosynthesis C-methylase UbiE
MTTPDLPARVAWYTRLKEIVLSLSLMVTPASYKARRLYDQASTSEYLITDRTLYLNMGYWKDAPQTLDDACDALAQLLGEAAQLHAGEQVLDVGFGFADQDIFWQEHFSPRQIVGLNVSPAQVAVARKRVAEHHLEQQITLEVGSATDMPVAHESFDKVVALECAFHFITREKFFKEAFRVLRPGGRIALADIVPLQDLDQFGRDPINQSMLRRYRLFAPIPSENWYARDTYIRQLETIGFTNIQMHSISEHVFFPFLHFVADRLQQDPEFKKRAGHVYKQMLLGALEPNSPMKHFSQSLDYVIAVADKPLP